MTLIPVLAALAYVNAALAFLHPVRDLRTSFDGCANSGCSEAGSTGKSCFRIVGTIEDYDDWNDSPQNEKEDLYPTDVPGIYTPISALSTSFCSPDGGKTNTKTIDGWFDGKVYGADPIGRLMPITTIPTDAPSPNTGIGSDAVETVIAETVFDSLISAASTETGLVSAIGSAGGTVGQASSTAIQVPTPSPVVSLTTTDAANSSTATSMRSTSTSSMISDTTSSTSGAPADSTGPGDSASGAGCVAAVQSSVCLVGSLLILMCTL
ncbi:MAG: hypothetical protein LQ349_007810 [Xanthoria aureola]|nr:MAG: hypothetical protein LQ349_007810 [Xanthoria aureola]